VRKPRIVTHGDGSQCSEEIRKNYRNKLNIPPRIKSFLAKHPGRVVTHKQILTAVWGPAHTEDTQYLRVYIGQLRQKVEEHPDDPKIVLTEPGIGYRIAES
jgi:DNA-binding response OmpR family regulator